MPPLSRRSGSAERDRATARDELEQSLRLSEQIGIRRRVAATQRLLGHLPLLEDREGDAECIYRAAIDAAGAIGDQSQHARLLLVQSPLLAHPGRKEQAVKSLRSARTIYEQIGDQRSVVVTGALLARGKLRQRRIVTGIGRAPHAIKRGAKPLRLHLFLSATLAERIVDWTRI